MVKVRLFFQGTRWVVKALLNAVRNGKVIAGTVKFRFYATIETTFSRNFLCSAGVCVDVSTVC